MTISVTVLFRKMKGNESEWWPELTTANVLSNISLYVAHKKIKSNKFD